jgi:uncharacterized membrane protein YuzA (DUF378 family)
MQDKALYWKKVLDMVTLVFLLLGGIILGIKGALDYDIFASLKTLGMVLYIIIGLSALYNVFSRDYYLPFLGDSAHPCGILTEKTPDGANAQVVITTRPYTSVLYWASEPNDQIVENPWLAYGSNKNAGVATSDAHGKAVLRVRSPSKYKVPSGRTLQPHIHYRVCIGNGMLSKIKTVNVKNLKI